MTTYINNESEVKKSFFSKEAQNNTAAAHHEAISIALANVSDRLDEGKSDAETVHLTGQLKAALIAAIQGQSATPTSLLPGVPTPTSLIPPAPIPTSLIPAAPTPTSLTETVGFIHNKAIADKLFAWIRIYTLNALYTMPGSMLENSAAIQKYMSDGLDKLSESVMKDSQAWSTYGQLCMSAVEATIQKEMASPTYPTDSTKESGLINNLTTQFNMQNTSYQKNLELFSSLNDGINQTSTSTTQTQTLNNQNITQGPLAMITMLTQCWSVIA